MSAPWRFNPCPGCCNCVFFHDAPSPTSMDVWDVISGTWDVYYQNGWYGLRSQGSDTKLLSKVDAPGTELRITFAAAFYASGDIIRVFFAGDDDSVGPYLEIEFSHPADYEHHFTYRLYDANGDLAGDPQTTSWPTSPPSTTLVGIALYFSVCLWTEGDDWEIVSVHAPGQSPVDLILPKIDRTAFTGKRHGIGSASGTVRFKDYTAETPNGDQCDDCYDPCPNHKWAETPSCLTLTVSGVVNKTGSGCNDCNCWNRDYKLPRYGCGWKDYFGTYPCMGGDYVVFCAEDWANPPYNWVGWYASIEHDAAGYYVDLRLVFCHNVFMDGYTLESRWRCDLARTNRRSCRWM